MVLLLPRPCESARLEFVSEHAKTRATGAEVCFFAASQEHDPFSLFLGTNDVRCLPGDKVIDVPSGNWNFFVEHIDGYVSIHRGLLMIGTRPISDDFYKAIKVPLTRSAEVDFRDVLDSLSAGEHFAVVTYPVGLPSSVLPLRPGKTSVKVPADVEIVPVLVADSRIKRVGSLHRLPPAGRLTVLPFILGSDLVDVIAWFKLDADSFFLETEETMKPPELVLRVAGEEFQPLTPVYHAHAAHLGFIIFKGVLPGTMEIQVRGGIWRRYEIEMDTKTTTSETVSIETPLLAVVGSKVVVDWSIAQASDQQDPGQRNSSVVLCELVSPLNDNNSHVATMRPACEARVIESQEDEGRALFEGISPGGYNVAIRCGTVSRERRISVDVGEAAEVQIKAMCHNVADSEGREH